MGKRIIKTLFDVLCARNITYIHEDYDHILKLIQIILLKVWHCTSIISLEVRSRIKIGNFWILNHLKSNIFIGNIFIKQIWRKNQESSKHLHGRTYLILDWKCCTEQLISLTKPIQGITEVFDIYYHFLGIESYTRWNSTTNSQHWYSITSSRNMVKKDMGQMKIHCSYKDKGDLKLYLSSQNIVLSKEEPKTTEKHLNNSKGSWIINSKAEFKVSTPDIAKMDNLSKFLLNPVPSFWSSEMLWKNTYVFWNVLLLAEENELQNYSKMCKDPCRWKDNDCQKYIF